MELDGIWVHLDLDVLDPGCMPAVDSPDADGLEFAELAGLLRVLLADPHIVGMDVTVFDPDLDATGGSRRSRDRHLGHRAARRTG